VCQQQQDLKLEIAEVVSVKIYPRLAVILIKYLQLNDDGMTPIVAHFAESASEQGNAVKILY
jgi:hypothetical protein